MFFESINIGEREGVNDDKSVEDRDGGLGPRLLFRVTETSDEEDFPRDEELLVGEDVAAVGPGEKLLLLVGEDVVAVGRGEKLLFLLDRGEKLF